MTIWQREAPRTVRSSAPPPAELEVTAVDGTPICGDVRIEIRPASSGHPGDFRLVIFDGAAVQEEYDGLTVGGATDAATVVNAHSRLVRVLPPRLPEPAPGTARQPGSRV